MGTPMNYAPPPPTGHRPKRQWWRAAWVLPVAGLILGFALGTSAGTTKTTVKTVAGPTVRVTATATVDATVTATPTKVIATHTVTATVTYTPPPPKQFGAGTYVVGTDIQPGTYHTAGSSDCYWARLSSLNTSDVIDNNMGPGPQTVQVMATDKAFTVSGACTFGRVG